MTAISFRNGSRTEWSPIRSVIIRVITKSDDHAPGVRFVNHELACVASVPVRSERNFTFGAARKMG